MKAIATQGNVLQTARRVLTGITWQIMVLAALSLGLSACSNSEQDTSRQEEQRAQQAMANKTAITSVLHQGATISANANGDYGRSASAMRTIDLTRCPSDFATAYLDHIHAWEDAANAQLKSEALKKSEGNAVAGGIVATVTGSEATPFSDHLKAENEANRQLSQASAEIIRTRQVVERIAIGYGAILPGQAGTSKNGQQLIIH